MRVEDETVKCLVVKLVSYCMEKIVLRRIFIKHRVASMYGFIKINELTRNKVKNFAITYRNYTNCMMRTGRKTSTDSLNLEISVLMICNSVKIVL